MDGLRPRSLQARLTLLVLAMVSVVWGVAALVTWRDVSHELDELLDSHLAQAAALLVAREAGEIGDDDERDQRHGDDRRHRLEAPQLHRYAGQVAFQVWHEGKLTLRSRNAPAEPMLADGQHPPGGFHTVTIAGGDWRVFATHGAERDIDVMVGEQLQSRRSILRAVLKGTLWPLALALPLLALAAWWAVRRGTEPLRGFSRTLAERRPDDLRPLPLDGAPSEVQAMLAALNGLFGRIDALMASERRFTADAAHELRTPIAAIRAQAQVALGEADDDARRHALQATLQGCDRATRLVEQLLTLARIEATAPPADATIDLAAADRSAPTDLAAVARSVVGELAARAIERGQSIGCDAERPGPIGADATLAAVLVRNLVDNASRYSPRGATIRVAIHADAAGVRLVVEDGGPGLAEAELARLGERFFRVLGSGESGSGLGWSIVRRIAQAQSAQVRVGRSDGLGGLRVEVAWPAAGQRSPAR